LIDAALADPQWPGVLLWAEDPMMPRKFVGVAERGVRHVEEMQLLASHIGPDRVSDIAANVLKQFLIEYTQRQAENLADSPSRWRTD
jgi:hypothetical protein